jgi:hypothetical protein
LIRILRHTALFLAVLGVIPALAETAMLECVSDTSIPSTDGHAQELRLPQLIMMNFRFAVIRNWSVSKATLLLHVAGGGIPGHLEIATIGSEWDERAPVKLDLRKLQFLGYKVETKPEAWISIEVSPSLIELIANGQGHGLALRDRSSAREHVLHSRESVRFAPYLIVEGMSR